eukprot:12703871-Alexandrium_andersonii.AAC.1
MWGESTRDGSSPILVRGCGSDEPDPDGGGHDDRVREDFRRDGGQDPVSELRAPGEILADLRHWEHANRLPQAEVVAEFGG